MEETLAINSYNVVELIDYVILEAIKINASDIHFEQFAKYYRIRYRKDGILFEIKPLPFTLTKKIITRIKIMSNLDITEQRLPQDGQFQMENVNCRVSICPTVHGEKIVIRLLNNTTSVLSLDSLGLLSKQKNLFKKALYQSSGMILITGPTGSGKSYSLYSALTMLNDIEKNIITIEDPVEIKLFGINQITVNNKIGLTFATILRSLLRQDPDIIMLGEMRCQETAKIAITAAQTGHLVLSTLHTNNTIETITRLNSMNIPTINIAEAVSLIVAQRLVRKLCNYCKIKHNDYFEENIYGCEHCINGFHGRTGIFELLPKSNMIKEAILQKKSSSYIFKLAKNEGLVSLYENGLEVVKKGVTSFSELNKVIK